MACYYIGAQARFISFHQMVVYLSWIFVNGNQWKYAHFASTSHPIFSRSISHFLSLTFIVRQMIVPVVGKMHTSFSWLQPCNCVYVIQAHTLAQPMVECTHVFFSKSQKQKLNNNNNNNDSNVVYTKWTI